MAIFLLPQRMIQISNELIDRKISGLLIVMKNFFKKDNEIQALQLIRYNNANRLLSHKMEYNLLTHVRKYSKKSSPVASQIQEDNYSDSDSDLDEDDIDRRRKNKIKKCEKGNSEFWRRKMRTLHRILDVNRDGVVSFDDMTLLAKRFTDLGHLSEASSQEFLDVIRQTWEEQFGGITPYNLVTVEQFLTDCHHRLNDKDLAKRIGRFLPYLFKAVDYDHSGSLNLNQYKLFFRCLGLTDEDAAISFAVIDKNGDGQLTLKEFVHLGRQFFLTENETKISKMFWGPLIDH